MTLTQTRRRLARLGAVCCAALLPLTAGVVPAAAQSVPDAPPAGNKGDAYVLPFAVLQGAPDVDPGREKAVFLWHDDAGLHLRTTGPGPERDFNGVLRATGDGQFADLDPVRLEHGDVNRDGVRLGPNARTIAFHFDTFGGVDGFDFRLEGDRFCLAVGTEGHGAAGVTHLGQGELRPDQEPVCFRR